MMSNAWTLTVDDDGIARLVVNVPDAKVNAFSTTMMADLEACLGELEQDKSVRCCVITSGKPGNFIAGADITELQKIRTTAEAHDKSRAGQKVFDRVAALPFPTLAVIDGACLGGGLEFALACTWRLASDNSKTKIGLPEANLGIIPGWGGTQRLPRLIGLEQACKMICSGKPVDGKKAKRICLADGIVSEAFIEEGINDFLAKALTDSGAQAIEARRHRNGMRRFLLTGNPFGRSFLFKAATKDVMSKSKGQYPAPLVAIDVLKRSATMNLVEGLELEALCFAELAVSDISRNLTTLFFAMEEAKKVGGDDGGRAAAMEHAGVLGAGVMGGGIAWLFSANGCTARVKDIAMSAIDGALHTAADYYGQMVKYRKMTPDEVRNRMLAIGGGTDWSGFGHSDIVVEAVIENLDIKRKVLAECEEHVPENCIIASNTSSLRIDDMASALKHPGRFCGMHFFNPVNRMPLVEIVRGEHTSEDTINTMIALTKRLGKTAVVVGDCPGFLVNRILLPYLNEAGRLFAEGADIVRVDKLISEFGMPMGPYRLADEVGIDVGVKVARILAEGYGERMAVAPILNHLYDEAHLIGKKDGRGFYTYHDGKQGEVNPGAVTAGKTFRTAEDMIRREHSDADIIDRCILIMVNEALRALEEKIVATPNQLDLAMIFGTGFPPFRGGLLRYADARGLIEIRDRLQELAGLHGARFEPAPLLIELASKGGHCHVHEDLPSAA